MEVVSLVLVIIGKFAMISVTTNRSRAVTTSHARRVMLLIVDAHLIFLLKFGQGRAERGRENAHYSLQSLHTRYTLS
jgi:hypothetical protein